MPDEVDSSSEDEYSTDADAYTDDDFTRDGSIDGASKGTAGTLRSSCDGDVGTRCPDRAAEGAEKSPLLRARPKTPPRQSTAVAEEKGSGSKICGAKSLVGAEPDLRGSLAGEGKGVAERFESFHEFGRGREQVIAEAKVTDDTLVQDQTCNVKGTPSRHESREAPYISVKDIQLSEAEAKHLYGIRKSEEDPRKIIIVHNEGERQEKSNCATYSLKRMEELAKPRDISSTLAKYSREAQQKEQEQSRTRKKRLKRREEQGGNFFDRMEAMEKQRRNKIERRSLELKYEAKVGKKVCPNCGGVQSFDEFEEDRKTCPNDECGGRFQYKSASRFVLKRFEKRNERNFQKRCDALEKIEAEREQMKEKSRGRKSRRQKELLRKVEKSGMSFLDRMSDDVAKRKDKINRLGEELQLQAEKQCTFKPQLNISDHLLRGRAQRDESFFAEPKHRKTDERPRVRTSGQRKMKVQSSKSRQSRRSSLKTRPPSLYQRRMALPKGKLPDQEEVARKFKNLLL